MGALYTLRWSQKNQHENHLCLERPGADKFANARKVRRGGRVLFGCKYCEEAFPTMPGLGTHMRKTHNLVRATEVVRRQLKVQQQQQQAQVNAIAKAKSKLAAKPKSKPQPQPQPKQQQQQPPKRRIPAMKVAAKRRGR